MKRERKEMFIVHDVGKTAHTVTTLTNKRSVKNNTIKKPF